MNDKNETKLTSRDLMRMGFHIRFDEENNFVSALYDDTNFCLFLDELPTFAELIGHIHQVNIKKEKRKRFPVSLFAGKQKESWH